MLSTRTAVIGFIAAAVSVLLPGFAHADPPSNDDFDTATTIAALPFRTTAATTGTTAAADDPTSCSGQITGSVWYRYTAPADGIVRTSRGGGRFGPFIAVYTGARGDLTQVPGACQNPLNGIPSATFHVTAGTTYHVLLFEILGGSGKVDFDFMAVPPEPNDAVAAATVAGLPAEYTGDLARASAEPSEPTASCDPEAVQSVWYRYTPERTRSVSLDKLYGKAPAISVHSGGVELDCVPAGNYLESVFTAVAGQTYYIRVADSAERAAWFDLRIATAPALQPRVNPYPDRPSVYTDVEFNPTSGDQLGRKLVSGEIRFGDGTSAPITGTPIRHKYTVDGTYQVEVTGSTNDGRTGTGSTSLKVETHDVSLTGFSAPATARVDQTKSLKVSVVNARYGETVKVRLLRQTPEGYFNEVGSLTQAVAAPGKVDFPFAYTYTGADAAAGKVTFKVVATLEDNHDDARPADNELVAVTKL
ncbi:PKD domain-containing protein [Amycolatopsis sp. NPDC059657]|uniref:PKD domain-containing protein n=1 Tax=Amycolatopsis sp. NPDC059657 TaxID=3346899 RepID=UPI00366ADA3B